ncbi:flagellar filament capping protein FliD [Vibrio alfacsensis]|uniref:flagellar filament capping protein FliD n=1 Tax=Vibrio alfacsensis TaxID=1074311 RepID=UPI002ADD9497|nr:flagellar filament capping protein FliD [Vibrio alfacsensis]WQE77845.1 flagellar filament capping protein FliD [Vibrio alfacsensis]
MSSIDPITMATSLATYEVQPFQDRYQLQADKYQAQIGAIGKVESAMREFRSVITSMSGFGNSVISNSASTSEDGFFSASVDANAIGGNYQIFVEQVATNHQASANFGGTSISADTEIPTTGEMKFTVNGEELIVDLSTVDIEGDGKATMSELVNTINNDKNNPGVNATLVRSNGETHLMFASAETGEANKVAIEVSGTTTGTDDWFSNAFGASLNTISEPNDAIIWLGAKDTGLKLTNASNTFEGVIEGVDITVTKAQTVDDAPISMAVGPDSEATKEQITKFIDAFNNVMSTIDEHMAIGGEDQKRGALASDSTMRSIKNQLSNMIRTEFSGTSLYTVGLSINSDGKLALDDEKFAEAQKNGGAALEQLFNGDGGLLDSMEKVMEPYIQTGSGMLSTKKETLENNVSRIDDKMDQLDRKYSMSYNRYLAQFTQMNAVITQMNSNMSLFG